MVRQVKAGRIIPGPLFQAPETSRDVGWYRRGAAAHFEGADRGFAGAEIEQGDLVDGDRGPVERRQVDQRLGGGRNRHGPGHDAVIPAPSE